jgi:glyoxylase-like metal-dependent hydrolase (beta-lactamase superfamily II)
MVDTLEAMLHYPLGDTLPEPGKTVELAPGVRWLRMGLPFALNHINLWLLQDEQDGQPGWTAVDCGIANDATRGHWEQIFATELQGLPLLRVVCTHMHPDHIGLASWLTERFSTPQRECRLWISATDWGVARLASQVTTGLGGNHAAADFFALHGLTDPEALAKVRARSNYYPSMVPSVPPRYRRLLHGMEVQIGGRAWRCIAGYGHAPEHMALYCEALGLLISGDMVLPRISTNISVFDTEPEANPLPLFLDSLERMRSLPAHTRVLPSHGKPFEGLHTRIDQLQDHHRDRLADVANACRQADCSAADLLPVLFKRSLDLHQTTFAMGESVAHVHALAGQGKLQPVPGQDGVLRWRTVAAA